MIKKFNIKCHISDVQKYLNTALFAAFTAISTVLGYSTPFGTVISAFLPLNLSFVFVAVMFVTRVLIGVDALSLAMLFSSVVIILFRLVRSKFHVKKKAFTLTVHPLIAYILCSTLFLISFSSELSEYLIAIIFSAIVFVLSLSYSKTSTGNISPIIFVALITLFSSIDFSYINIGRVFGIYSVLAIGYSFGSVSACYVGILTSIGTALYNPEMFSSTVFTCIIAMICSEKGTSKKLQIPLYSVSIAIICAVLSGYGTYSIGFVIDTLIASSIYLFTDKKAFSFVSERISDENHLGSASSFALSQINSQIQAVSSVSDFLKNIINAPARAKSIAPLDSVYSELCLKCQNHNFCYKADSSDPRSVLSSCAKRNEVEKHLSFLKRKNDYLSRLSASKDVKLKETISTFDTIISVISDISSNSADMQNIDVEMTKKLSTLLSESRIDTLACYVFRDKGVYVDVKNGRRISETKLCLIISDLMHYDYSLPEVILLGNSLLFHFCKKPIYSFDFGVYLESADDENCGDSYEHFTFGNKLYCILSDGMGTGKLASISSSMLISIIKRQLLCGMGAEPAVSLASIAMQAIGTDESFATLDLLSADLNTGELKFIKAGSCNSYVIGEGIRDIHTGGYPIGILYNTSTEAVVTQVTDDITAIVMLTDGAKDIPYQIIEKTVRDQILLPSEELAQSILDNAKDRLNRKQRDDLTIAVIKIEKR